MRTTHQCQPSARCLAVQSLQVTREVRAAQNQSQAPAASHRSGISCSGHSASVDSRAASSGNAAAHLPHFSRRSCRRADFSDSTSSSDLPWKSMRSSSWSAEEKHQETEPTRCQIKLLADCMAASVQHTVNLHWHVAQSDLQAALGGPQ